MSKRVFTVSQINTYIRSLFSQDMLLSQVRVSGEVSEVRYHSSGHIYFTLKDPRGTLSCIMFSGSRNGLRFRLETGMQVIVSGYVNIYEAQSKFQLYARQIEQEGLGDLHARFEALKQELAEKGLFDQSYKQQIPRYAKTVGVVTAPGGAAIRDIIQIAGRRNPYVQIILYPAQVQGEGAAATIAHGIKVLDSLGLDVLIVGRGGGSAEDLWAFNEREVAEAVFDADTPVISAVGHETDFTICDMAADLRAPTPSAAAELAVYNVYDLDENIASKRFRLYRSMRGRIAQERSLFLQRQMKLRRFDPVPRIQQMKQQVSDSWDRMQRYMRDLIDRRRQYLAAASGRLDALSPLKLLQSGYAYVEADPGGRIRSAAQTKAGDRLKIRFNDGTVSAEVTRTDIV